MGLAEASRLFREGRLLDSEAQCRAVIAGDRSDAGAHHLLGAILHSQGRTLEAAEEMRRAVTLAPESLPLRVNLAAMLGQLGKLGDALAELRAALRIGDDLPELHNNLGVTLEKLGRLGEAATAYRRAIALRPNYAEAYYNFGNTLRKAGRITQAAAAYRRALSLRPDYAKAYDGLAAAAVEIGDADEAIACYRRMTQLNPADAGALSALLYTLHYSADETAESLFREHRQWDARFGGRARAAGVPTGGMGAPSRALFERLNRLDGDAARAHVDSADEDIGGTGIRIKGEPPAPRLRIGYVSPDFRDHTVPRFVSAAIEHHDRERFEVFCYCDVERPDATTARLRGWAEQWREIRGQSDDAVEAMIRQDRIDILVDLRGHGGNNRLTLFARKPAPIQINMVGYFDTTGLSAMDYRLTDGHMDPPGASESLHSEKLLRMPRSCWCYSPDEDARDVAEPPMQRNGFITFGSLNKIVKISEPCARLWASVLEAVPGSRLLLSASGAEEAAFAQSLRGRLARLGLPVGRQSSLHTGLRTDSGAMNGPAHPPAADRNVCPTEDFPAARDRIVILGKTASRREYLERFHEIDIALDTFSFNGITTTCDGLWMGVPTISLAGETSVSRAGRSILHAANLGDMATNSAEQFVKVAAELSRDADRLRALRLTMRDRLRGSALLDHRAFARELELQYGSVTAVSARSPRTSRL